MISVETKVELERQVKNIADIISEKYIDVENIGVLGGLSGIALFQFYCAQYFNEDSYAETGAEIIGSCVDKINDGYYFPTYCDGIAGFGWTLQHLIDLNFIDLDVDELLAPLDDHLKNQMEFEFNNENYDPLHGGMGYGLYFIKRYRSQHTSKRNKKRYKGFLIRLVELLAQMAIEDRDGLKWVSVLNIEKGTKGFNLSLSHGMNSIVHLLYKMHQSQIEKDKIENLMRGTLSYILRFEKLNQTGQSLFPSWINPNQNLDYNSRVAWCYGDIGIAKALQWGAEILEDNNLIKKSKDVLAHTSSRKSPKSSKVQDAGYCHGSFGNAHIFHQLGINFNDKQFKKVAGFWLLDGLSRHTKDDKIPYKQWNTQKKLWEFELSLLEGISGIGLVMLDFLSGRESTWDECLMLR